MNENTFVHPEKQEHEVFFTNATARQFRMMRWKTKRIGKNAYDANGKYQSYRNWYPVFLAASELDEVKADLLTERKTWRQIMDQLDLNPSFNQLNLNK